MSIFYTIILTIICWQLICVIVDIITNDHQECVGLFAFGIWIPIIFFIAFVVKKVKLFSSRKYNYYQLFGNISSTANSMGGWLVNKYMTKVVADKYFARQFDKDEPVTESYSIRLLRNGKEFKSAPYASDILTADKIEQGDRELSADLFKKFQGE